MKEPARTVLLVLALAGAPGCRVEEDVGQAFPGPPCDCSAFFPICVGVTWTYTVVDQVTGDPEDKAMSIVDYADPRHERHQMTGFLAYRQRRVTDEDAKDSWLVRSPDGHSLLWLIDHWTDEVGRPTRTRYYVPGKLRIDETPARLIPGATWSERYTEYRIEWPPPGAPRPGEDGPPEIVLEHDVDWETVGPEDHGEFTGSVCQQKLDITRDTAGNEVERRESKYCFVPGVGKVYERTPLVEVEHLIDHAIPGC